MRILSPSILRLFRCSIAASSPVPAPQMHSLLLRHLLAAPNRPVRHVLRAPFGSPSMSSSVGEKDNELHKTGRCLLIPSATGPNNDVTLSLGECFAINQVIDNEEKRGAIKRSFPRHGHGHGYAPSANEEMRSRNEDIVYGNKYVSTPVMEVSSEKSYSMGTTSKVSNAKQDDARSVGDIITFCGDGHSSDGEVDLSECEDYENSAEEEDSSEEDDIVPRYLCIFDDSSHRDGSIYRGTIAWKEVYRIADRSETQLEAMTLWDPNNCVHQPGGVCATHHTGPFFQFFSVKLAKIPMDRGSIQLYGYIAVRDRLDPLLNYIVNISRDNPVIMEQGSLIEMSGPKRGIDMCGDALLEYDMRIKTGDREEDDLQLIDGVSVLPDIVLNPCYPYTNRLHGGHGAVDITRALLYRAVEATIDVAIIKVRSNFDLSLSSFTSGIDEEIQLFRGAIGEARRLRGYVVAVVLDTLLHLKFKVGSEEQDCYFKATMHGCISQHVRTELASFSVKVVWSTMPWRWPPR